jgi:hypothetical protein
MDYPQYRIVSTVRYVEYSTVCTVPTTYQPYPMYDVSTILIVHSYLKSYSYEELKIDAKSHLTIWSIEDRIQLETPQT